METITRAARLLTAPEVAERLGVRLHRVYELIRTNRLPVVRLGRNIRVDPGALESWIANGGTAAVDDAA
jgi:excisionase family DNA binding protein